MVDVIVLAGTAKSSELTIAEQAQNKAFIANSWAGNAELCFDCLQQTSSSTYRCN